jgi:hypothetical protein
VCHPPWPALGLSSVSVIITVADAARAAIVALCGEESEWLLTCCHTRTAGKADARPEHQLSSNDARTSAMPVLLYLLYMQLHIVGLWNLLWPVQYSRANHPGRLFDRTLRGGCGSRLVIYKGATQMDAAGCRAYMGHQAFVRRHLTQLACWIASRFLQMPPASASLLMTRSPASSSCSWLRWTRGSLWWPAGLAQPGAHSLPDKLLLLHSTTSAR